MYMFNMQSCVHCNGLLIGVCISPLLAYQFNFAYMYMFLLNCQFKTVHLVYNVHVQEVRVDVCGLDILQLYCTKSESTVYLANHTLEEKTQCQIFQHIACSNMLKYLALCFFF